MSGSTEMATATEKLLDTVCSFPALLNEEDELPIATRAQVEVELPSHEVIRDFSLKYGISIQVVLETVWAIALKTFTGDENICLASLSQEGSDLITAAVEDDSTLIDVLGVISKNKKHFQDGYAPSDLSCNSGVCFVESTEQIVSNFDQFDVLLHAVIDQSQWRLSLWYQTSHLAHPYATIVAATVSQILGEILADPSRPLSQINLVHPQVRHELQAWSNMTPASIDRCVGEMFEKTVQERPLHTAVNTSDLTLTYQELDFRSATLARELQKRGVVPEAIVVLCFPKSAWAVVAMMAVIRAGGAILFLDPSHPTARHQEIIGQVDTKWIITAPEYSQLWEWFDGDVLLLDDNFVSSLGQSPDNESTKEQKVQCSATPSSALYVIFTSGSTGKPKGCVVEHRQFLTGSLAQQKASKMTHEDRVLQLASFTFDVSILEIITSLISGACVCIPNDQERAKGPAACIQQFGVTWAFLTPSLVNLMAPEMVPTLQFLVLGGEAVQQENINIWAPHVRLANGYGPTECSIAATAHPGLSLKTSPSNIGHPLGGCCWIVDKDNHNRLLPIGAPGELVIQGPIVARGYLNELEKTRAVFLESVQWMESGPTDTSRLYKTGDLARFNADGSLFFLGRKDSQVKLRGLRIELGEIEHRLADHPLVEQAVVVLAKQGPCQGKLCAVLSLKSLRQDTVSLELVEDGKFGLATEEIATVAAALSQQLPSYMQPTVWAPVQCIPLTVSGKQNGVLVRKWVADMSLETFDLLTGRTEGADSEKVQPSTDEEIELQALCSAILGFASPEDIWLNKSFIQNGGDSIQAMQLLDHLRRKQYGVGLEDLLQSTTLIDLAQRMASNERVTSVEEESAVVSLNLERIKQLGFNVSDVEDLYPVSSVQRGILLSQQQSPDRYQLRITCEILPPSGQSVKLELLREAWKQLTKRHPALRTVFVEAEAEDGLCDQLVLTSGHGAFMEWSHNDETAVWAALNAYKREDEPLQPPVAFIVSHTSDGKVFGTIDISHALIDGVSILILLRDLSQAYAGLMDSQIVRYAPYIQYLQTLPSNDSLEYWTKYLDDASPCHFPALNDDLTSENQLHELTINMEDADAIQKFCATHNVTPATVFQAAWALVLKAYTGQDDVCFGYLTAGRDFPVPNISNAVGVFINMMTYRMRLAATDTVADVIKETQEGFLRGLSHQQCSIAEIQHALGVSQPLFNTIMSLQSALGEEIAGADIDKTIRFRVVNEQDPTEYNISVNVFVSKVRVSLTLRYFTEVLSDGMAANVFDTFHDVVQTLIHSYNSTLPTLTVLSERDQSQIASWNQTQWPDVHACVHDLVHQQVLSRPSATAIEAWDGSFTYKELDEVTTSLACILRENGVGPEVLVPICFSKSSWTVIAQLSTLKAGGACVAFDPEHPQSRREEMLRQCGATIALVGEGKESLFHGLVDRVVLVAPGSIPNLPTQQLKEAPSASPNSPAFVVFTSGSTGKPKGIVLEHHALCSSARAHGPAMNYGPDARVLQFASYTFDVSIGETFTCLMSGGTLCIPNEDERLNDLAGVINRMNTNVVYLTPSVVSLLQPSQVPGVHTLALGGEAVREDNILTWADQTNLVNIYGPAECSVWSTGLTGVPRSASPRNIGYGLGARMWITHADDPSQLCAVGAVGEILIEGPIVARGYLGDEAKTAAVFISPPAWLSKFDSHAAQQSIKLYRTGDLAHYNSDGSINFVGRRDHQVKLHGQRVEMGEIDHALLSHEAVQNALALVPKQGALKGKLVAVISLKRKSSVPATDRKGMALLEDADSEDVQTDIVAVRQRVSSLLPGYMVPAHWLTVQTIPMTRNGKSDRPSVTVWVEQLSEDPTGAANHLDRGDDGPQSPIETELQHVISEVLNLSLGQVAMEQSFLALGGDSITAMQVSSRSRSRGLQVAVKNILKGKSIREIASQATLRSNLDQSGLNGASDIRQFSLLPRVEAADIDALASKAGYNGAVAIEDAYPCSPMQEGILISQAQAPETYKFYAVCSIRSTNPAEPVSLARLHKAWTRLVARHPSLRTFFVEGLAHDGLYSQVVLKEHTPQLETASDLTTLFQYPEEYPLDYQKSSPPHRLIVLQDQEGATHFNLEISHTLIDGGSMAIILRDLAKAYDGELQPGPLYRDYIAMLRNQSMEETLLFWTSYLENVKPVFFPSLLDAPATATRKLQAINIPIAPATVLDLQTFTKQHEVTLANVFQSVWALVLRAYTGESDIVFGYLSSGRDVEGLDMDMDNAVGAFITMLACRAQIDDDLTLLDVTRRMHEDFINSLPYQQTSLAQVQHALKLSGERLFNSILSLQRPMVDSNNESSIAIEYLGGSDPTEYDLGVSITVSDTAIEVSINYWSTFMESEQADMLASTFTNILSKLIDAPTKAIEQVDLLGQKHMEYILDVNHNGQVPETVNDCIHTRIHRRALTHPDAPAIHSWDASLSYGELDKLSSRLAGAIISLGVTVEDAVPLCFDKSAWAMVSMLAVLKAGAAYVSMNPSHPTQHLASIIAQTKARIVLVGSSAYSDKVKSLVDNVLVVDPALFHTLPEPNQAIFPPVSSSNAAMINFTSGSTGKPKGIVVLHKGLCSLTIHNEDMQLDHSSRVLQFSAYTFDTSNSEMFFTLCRGGCVCVPSDDDRLNDLAGAINRFQVTYAYLTPSVALTLSPESVPTLKTLALVGEAVPADLARKWQDRLHLINSYGPAECTIMSSFNVIREGVAAANIGKAHGCLFWVTEPEDSQRLVPVGRVGELLIEGPLVTRGYLDPELTTKVFIQPPRWRGPTLHGTRLYKTGDLVRYAADGSLVYVGRKDSQIKLNGQRVEMGEVEKTIASDSLVQQCVILLPKQGPSKKKLVAVVVLEEFLDDECQEITPIVNPTDKSRAISQVDSIRERLASVLPSYMIPSVWLVCLKFPYTPSRKVDRPRISQWVEKMDHETYVQAAAEEQIETSESIDDTPSEANTAAQLRNIVARVLNISSSQASLSRSFLSLGGDSITAMQLVVQCRNEGLQILFKDVMRSTSIAALAQCAENVDSRRSSDRAAEQWDTPFGLSPIQQLYFQEISQGATDAAANQFNQSFLLRLTQDVSIDQLRSALDRIMQRHSMLRARFRKSHRGEWTQIIPSQVSGSYRFRVHTIESEDEARALSLKAQSQLDIQNGPVFAAEIFTVADKPTLLFLVAHHLVIDLVSWRILFQEVEDSLTDKASLSDLAPFSFQRWQRQQADYASKHLRPKMVLPYSIPPADYEFWGMKDVPNYQEETVQLSATLDAHDTELLLSHSHKAMRTEPLDILIAALLSSFKDTFGRQPPAIFNEGHGRQPAVNGPLSDIDLSDSVGWFTTVFPFHVPVEASGNSLDIVRQVKDQRKELPANGWSYFTSKYHNEDGTREFANHMPVEVLFNYLGLYQGLERADGVFQRVPFNEGDVGPSVRRYALFEINVYVVNGSAHATIAFNRNMKHQEQVTEWLSRYTVALRELSQQLMNTQYTLTRSDYPLLSISYPKLDHLHTQRLPELGYQIDSIEDIYPCSPLQEGILLSQTRMPDAYLYHAILRLTSAQGRPVDPQQLISSWQQVVDRHSILRTAFLERVSSRPFDQMVLVDHQANSLVLGGVGSEKEAIDILGSLAPLSSSSNKPQHRLAVVQANDETIYFKLDISHALMDGTAMAILIHDLASAYINQLPLTPATSYSEYIGYIQSQPADEALEFWATHLAGVQPSHFPALTSDSSKEQRELQHIDVPVPEIAKVRTFCQQHDVTLANIVRLAWAVVLSAYTGEENICFGYLTAGREVPVPGVESAVGPFINMLVCAMDMSQMGQKTVVEELKALHEEYLQNLPYQHVGLAEIQHRLGLSGQTLFNTVVSFQRRDVDNFQLGDLKIDYIQGEDPTEYDITLNVTDTDRGFTVQLGYLTSRLSSEQALNVSEALSAALSSIVSAPRSPVTSVDLFSSRHREQVLQWNKTIPATIDECLHSLFERSAKASPDALAIASWDEDLSYAQLDKKTTQLARVLVSMRLGPDDLVPICFDKSSWAIVAMLGILKAGAGFVPLDPAHPPERLASIIAQTSSSLALVSLSTSKRVVDLVPNILVISSGSNMWLDSDDSLTLPAAPTTRNIAYTLFTSGSTGTPKGVVVEHSAVSTSIIHHGKEIGCSPATRMFQFAAYTFDACILEIFTTLAYGGCICVPSEADRMSDIAGSIRRLQANTTFLTPSVVRILRPDQVPTLSTIILGGEALDRDNIQTWAAGSDMRLMNGYGPTETCVFCVMHTFTSKTERHDILGRAVSSLSWIVRPGDHNHLAPIGSVGELLVQGGTLARGYLHDDDKTAKSFIVNPDFATSGPDTGAQRFYKTGDLVRYNADGTITYLGRKDTQIKLRGQRIELAEIEHQIQRQLPPNVQIAVEVVLPHGEKEQALLAAFICQPSSQPDFLQEMTPEARAQLGQLKQSLFTVLPPYMQPSLFLPTNWMPTTSAKKLDRHFLRSHCASLTDVQLKVYSLQGEESRRAPNTVLEKKVQELWHRVLKVPMQQIYAEDSFFQVGGDSIAAMKMAATSDDISITVADIFRHPVLADLAAALAAKNQPEKTNGIPVEPFELLSDYSVLKGISTEYGIPPECIQDAYPSTSLQEGMMALAILNPGAYVLRKVLKLTSSIDIARFQSAWETVSQKTPILRTRLVPTTDGSLLQLVVNEHIEWRSAQSLQDYLELDARESIRYGAPLVRYAITADGHFVWTAHHSVYDGWSLPMILEQVRCAYENGDCSDTPRFNTFIKHLVDIDPQSTRNFWQKQLEGQRPSSFPELPSPSYRPSVRGSTAHKMSFSHSPNSPILKTTVLRAAWAFVLSFYTDSPDVVFGMTLSGRNGSVSGIDKMIAPVITTVPVRVAFPPAITVEGFLQQVQQQATDMIPHEHFGLQNIANLSSECARAIEFQNLFVIQPASELTTTTAFLGCEEVDLPLQDFDSYPLVVECYLADGDIHIETRHDEAILSAWQVQNMLYHFESLVNQLTAVENAGRPIEQIEMFGEKDLQQILEWNQVYPEVVESTVPQVFAQQVAERPSALAVDAWDGQLTYADLDYFSSILARHLHHLGVGPEVLVPMCFDKSRWAVVAQMSVIKAGGACVNLDPKHPQARLETIVRDAGAPILLCAPSHSGILGSALSVHEVTVTEEFIRSLASSNDMMASNLPDLSPRNAAYVLFTSGSTGKPKGIVIEHGSLCSSSKAHGSRWGIGPNTRLLQFAAYTFDVSCADIFTTLQRGGCICVPSEHDRLNALPESINHFRCNWAFLTPTVASLLPADNIPSLKTLVLGGEASSWDTIAKWHSVLDLIVCYGPAECSVYCSGAPPATATSDPANLGASIGALYWIADPQDPNRLTPVGCVGELLLEGPTVAREYLHDPAKTASAFVRDPTWAPSRTHNRPRMFYRTGDLVRYNEDGTIRFAGRKDTQVKVRGQRVELGEIEHAIRLAMPSLAHATVDAVKDPSSARQTVVAFLHFSNRSGSAELMEMTAELRENLIQMQQTLSQSLPSYMIPSMFLPLARVPLTMNGKADRRQLRDLALSLSQDDVLAFSLADGVKQEPTTETEFQLRELWVKLLNVEVESIGAGDHFFRSGGDSIIAMKLTSLARARGWPLSVQEVFQFPILSDMAAHIDNEPRAVDASSHVAYQPFSLIQTSGSELVDQVATDVKTASTNIADILPATDFQSSAIAHSMMKTRGLLNYLFLDGQGSLPWTVGYVQSVWSRFLSSHQILRTVFTARGDRFYQVVLKQISQEVEWYETDRDIDSFCAELCRDDVQSDLQLGDSLTKLIIVGSQTHHRVILRLSHAQYDGVCLPQIWQTLQDVFLGKTPSPEAPFAQYVAAVNSHNGAGTMAYWRTLLQDSQMTNVVNHAKPSYRNVYDLHLTRTIPVPVNSRPSSGITFATILKASWATVLAALSDTTDVVFGHVTSGRNIPGTDMERIIGACLNIIPVRASVNSSTSATDLLQSLQSQHIASMAHESIGMRQVVRECSSWAPFTRFSSIVQHQNIEQIAAVTLADREYTIGDFCPAADEADVAIKTTPLDGNQMEVLFITSSQSVGESVASTLLDLLCQTIQRFCQPDSAQLQSAPAQWLSGKSMLPLAYPSPIPTLTANGTVNGAPSSSPNGVVSLIYDSWRLVLGAPDLSLDLDSDFFLVGGDLVSVALLAATLRQHGFNIAVEDLIDRSVLQGMAETLLRSKA
ncbi:putative nonribosomal peptide synthase [Aspergillus clavatus NRRL 1]|uniref:Nonribosomal peptide synthase, putative n=1 Tax=Aspergillus clavatus (strain ATCC 1007 / CBS 513.65 / DSM 816 / NCTC 3887 / NRRL 1 / QM 1276 / 107) TaxID=344612 RepID=A1CFN0_ASPCL|nr:nonribosomal peptide synthase, putative [Aspergillus clavatus NRRL 1]EAW11679.1 nonribosomal peptide synthase, putative [Aspergillus clavatus NRRL 1]